MKSAEDSRLGSDVPISSGFLASTPSCLAPCQCIPSALDKDSACCFVGKFVGIVLSLLFKLVRMYRDNETILKTQPLDLEENKQNNWTTDLISILCVIFFCHAKVFLWYVCLPSFDDIHRLHAPASTEPLCTLSGFLCWLGGFQLHLYPGNGTSSALPMGMGMVWLLSIRIWYIYIYYTCRFSCRSSSCGQVLIPIFWMMSQGWLQMSQNRLNKMYSCDLAWDLTELFWPSKGTVCYITFGRCGRH